MPSVPARWEPKDFVARAAQMPVDELATECGARFVLVIPVAEPQSELAQGLSSAFRKERGLAFRTLQGDAMSMLGAAGRKPVAPPRFPMHSWDVPGTYVPVPRRLLEASCHVAPLCKRLGGSFVERVTVGRAHGHDIVLCEASVSKFHAFFEQTEDGQLLVSDAGSRNHVFVNGTRIDERARVLPGATVTFGLLETYVYTLESFWKALRP